MAYGSKNKNLYINNEFVTSIIIPDSVTRISDSAFYNCNLTSVIINDNVTRIESAAFKGCSLTSVTIGNGVTRIGYEAFRDCNNLTSVYISDIAK